MAEKPFISQEERPNLSINLEGKVGDLTVRELGNILGINPSSTQKLKELPSTALEKSPIKDSLKEAAKDSKDQKDAKEHKDQKEPKDRKDQKDNKDHKDPKESKDQKDQKEEKDRKEQKETKDNKDQKDPKEHKDQKDHKDPKEHKDFKDHKDIKEGLKEVKEGLPEAVATKADPEIGPPPGPGTSELDSLIQRVSGLEQAVSELKQAAQK